MGSGSGFRNRRWGFGFHFRHRHAGAQCGGQSGARVSVKVLMPEPRRTKGSGQYDVLLKTKMKIENQTRIVSFRPELEGSQANSYCYFVPSSFIVVFFLVHISRAASNNLRWRKGNERRKKIKYTEKGFHSSPVSTS